MSDICYEIDLFQSYKALQKKMESLKTLLAVHQIPDTGNAPNRW